MNTAPLDATLLERFRSEVESKVPRRSDSKVLDPTPLVDLTSVLTECAKAEFGLSIRAGDVQVLGKLDSKILGGSVKMRPAVGILSEAIASGKVTRETIVFEASSGNFGLALGTLKRMGLRIVLLVSRKLQQGVIDQLERDGVLMVNLDIDICPAPGMVGSAETEVARVAADSVRRQLAESGIDPSGFDSVRQEVVDLLAQQDAIGLAKVLARAYGGFCPEQYDNELNVRAHLDVTGPEIDQQLKERGASLADFDVVCTFGTGGTATGLSRYARQTHSRNAVRVTYPLPSQDVAGIRTKPKAMGLRFYSPEAYGGEHEVDFENARRLFSFFNRRGYDIGESGALALYCCIELINYGASKKMVAIIADGSSKYGAPTEAVHEKKKTEVTLEEAASNSRSYAAVIWTHGSYVPRDNAVNAMASSLGIDVKSVRVAKAKDVMAVMTGKDVPEVFKVPDGDSKLLLVCLVGATSLSVAKTLASKGIAAESLVGGITGIPAVQGAKPMDYLAPARE